MTDRWLVLLSGGLDSTAALLWARRRASEVHALFVYYGQPAHSHECERALAVTRELGVPFHRVDVASAFYGGPSRGIMAGPPSGVEGGRDTAFLPMRNPLLLSTAAARGLLLWPDDPLVLVAGFNADDAAGFPDCTLDFVDAFETAMNLGLGRPRAVSVETPWVQYTKRQIVDYVRAFEVDRMPLIEQSWSCYRERGPCGECTACKLRTAAL